MLEGRPWHISAAIDGRDIKAGNKDALTALEGGASALFLMQASALTANDLTRLLEQVRLECAPLSLAPAAGNMALAQSLMDSPPQGASLTLGIDPIGHGAPMDGVVDVAKFCHQNFHQRQSALWKAVTLDGRVPHGAGASEAQEIAYIACAAISVLRALTDSGMDIDAAIGQISFLIPVDSDAHLSVIKLRAARHVWGQIVASFNASPADHPMDVRAITSLRMMSAIDPWSNLLRLTTASFAAIMGGVSHITTLPFTQALASDSKTADGFARRLSRNIGLLLMEESRAGHVVDPASGSYMHETMTAKMASKAWAILQDIEAGGGIVAALESGFFARMIKPVAKARMGDVASAKLSLVGVNSFAKIKTRPVTMRKISGKVKIIQPSILKARRLSQPFEMLRAASAKAKPVVTLLPLSKACADRVQFTQNYLACGGIENAILSLTPSTFALARAFENAPSRLLIIIGSDDDYAELKPQTLDALRAACPCAVWACATPEIRAKTDWMSGSLYAGQDRVAALSEALGLLGVQIHA